MPNRYTFQIKPIAELLSRYVGDGKGWVDPFVGKSVLAEFSNDLSPDAYTSSHLDALAYCKSLSGKTFVGVLFDPPYSLRQMKEVYNSVGIDKLPYEHTIRFYGECKRLLSECVAPGGLAISFGWNSIGMGIGNGFEPIEILMVCHGRAHNDTIVTVEVKVR